MESWQKSGASERAKGVGLLVVTAVLWSSSGFFIKWIDWHPLAFAATRALVAAIFIRLAFRRSALSWDLPQLIGAVAYAANIVCFCLATRMTTAANAIVLQYTAPVYVAVLGAVFLREKPRAYDWLTIAAVGGGMILFFQDQVSFGGMIGNLLGMASGVLMAAMTVSLRRQKDGSPFGSVFLGNILLFICGLPFVFEGSPGAVGWLVIVTLGCFQMGLAYVLYTTAIKYVTALEASIVTFIEPILNPIWVFLLLGEKPGPWSLVGGIVIMAAITARCVLPNLKTATS